MTPLRSEMELRPLTLAFPDERLESDFLGSLRQGSVERTRRSFLLGILAWCAFGLLDRVILPAHVVELATLFYGVGLPTLLTPVVLAITIPRRRFERHWEWIAALTAGACGLILVAMQAVVGNDMTPYGYVALLIGVVLTHTLIPFRSLHATIVSAAVIAPYLVLVGVVAPIGAVHFVNNAAWLLCAFAFVAATSRQAERLRRADWYQGILVEREREKSDALLLNILPEAIAARLKDGEETIADGVDVATVMFADIAGFTPLADRLPPARVVELLNGIFSRFDTLADRYGLEKIKTIGDAYMVVGGLSNDAPAEAEAVARMALAMCAELERLVLPECEGLSMRIGIHCGPVVAGVIGRRKYSYDVWGDTVNTASRMESHGVAGRIHVSDEARALLAPSFMLEERGVIGVKGKGPMRTWFLDREREAEDAREPATSWTGSGFELTQSAPVRDSVESDSPWTTESSQHVRHDGRRRPSSGSR